VRRVVSNTGPLLHLGEAAALDLLKPAGEILIPPSVETEMRRHDDSWQRRRPDWVVTKPLDDVHDREASGWHRAGLLEVGEADAIALARQCGAHWFLTDDAAARVFADSLGLEAHGSLGIVLWAAATGRLTHADAENALDRLGSSSLWVSLAVMQEARAALGKLFSR
jgi:predicted nucleic acid-binding protein